MASNLPVTPKKRKISSCIQRTPQKTPRKNEQYDAYMKYFEFVSEEEVEDVNKKWYKCKICFESRNGTKPSNLLSHLQRMHKDDYLSFIDAKNTPLQVQRLELLQNLVEMVALNGRPFTIIHDSGFQAIIRRTLEKLDAGGFGLSLSHHNFPEVKKHMHEMATKVRDKLKEEFRGRAISLLADIVTKNCRSIFGFSAQLLLDGEHKVRSIGMIELRHQHTAVYLADVLCNRLELYEIRLQQIFTITTDNAANVQKMIRDVDSILKKKISVTENLPLSLLPQSNQTDDEISELLANEQMSDDDLLMIVFNEAIPDMFEKLLSNMSEEMTTRAPNVLWTVESIRCAAHKAQLAIKDAVQNLGQSHRNVIALTRQVAKILRTESIRNEMRDHGLQYVIPRMDIETRWGYLYLMVSYYPYCGEYL